MQNDSSARQNDKLTVYKILSTSELSLLSQVISSKDSDTGQAYE